MTIIFTGLIFQVLIDFMISIIHLSDFEIEKSTEEVTSEVSDDNQDEP